MMNNFFGQQNQGFGYANQRVPKFTNPVTLNKDSLKLLQNKGSGFSLAIDEVDKVKAVCTHKEGNTISLKENGDGTVTCWLCHETFRIEDMDESYVEELVRRMNDVLQVVKTYYLDIPVQVAETYFQFIPYLKKLPQLYKIALDNFNQHDMGYKLQQNNNPYGMNMVNAIFNPAAMFGGMGGMNPNMMGGMNPNMNPNMMGGMNPNMMGGMNPNMNPNMMGGQGGMYGNPFVQNMGGNNMNTGMPNNMGGGQAAPAQQNGNVEQNKVFNV